MTTDARPNLKPARTSVEYALEAVSLIAVVAAVSIIGSSWGSLPERVSRHFGAAGTPDAFGSKGSILAPAALSLGLYLLLSLVQLVPPRLYNYPVRISQGNALAQYRLARKCLAAVKAAICVLLALGTWLSVQVALGHREGLGAWFIPGVVLAVASPLVWYGLAASRERSA